MDSGSFSEKTLLCFFISILASQDKISTSCFTGKSGYSHELHFIFYTNSLSLANFVGIVVGFFNVCTIRLRRLLLAASLSFESEMVLS
jgi:hypothetical protein